MTQKFHHFYKENGFGVGQSMDSIINNNVMHKTSDPTDSEQVVLFVHHIQNLERGSN